MIPRASITQWAAVAPWPTDVQIEQDLILSRLIIDVANDELLGPELAFRGGTCLNKLCLAEPVRYSEDLDYVRRTATSIKPFMEAIRRIGLNAGLEEHGTDRSWNMVRMFFDTEPTVAPGRIRVKFEINVREIQSHRDYVSVPYSVASAWWSGQAEVRSFSIEELMGTKLRALHQRRKGRDLLDLWIVLTTLAPDDEGIVAAFRHYMGSEAFTYRQFAETLRGKLSNAGFRGDIDLLVAEPPEGYDVDAAADLVMERLGSRLEGAPDLPSIQDGAWRT